MACLEYEWFFFYVRFEIFTAIDNSPDDILLG
jgi:hypothetical protein